METAYKLNLIVTFVPHKEIFFAPPATTLLAERWEKWGRKKDVAVKWELRKAQILKGQI